MKKLINSDEQGTVKQVVKEMKKAEKESSPLIEVMGSSLFIFSSSIGTQNDPYLKQN